MNNNFIEIKLKSVTILDVEKNQLYNYKYRIKFDNIKIEKSDFFRGITSKSVLTNNEELYKYLYNLSDNDFSNLEIKLYYDLNNFNLIYTKIQINLGLEELLFDL